MNSNIRILQVEDVTTSYVNWFTNSDVIKYSDNQYLSFSLNGQRSFVESCLNNSDIDLYGIFDDKVHIGNIQISGLKSHHKRAELSYVIGDSSYWNRGAASQAIFQLISLGKNKYSLNKLYASLSAENKSSKAVLEKNGFVLEGVRKQHLYYGGKFHDQLDYGFLL